MACVLVRCRLGLEKGGREVASGFRFELVSQLLKIVLQLLRLDLVNYKRGLRGFATSEIGFGELQEGSTPQRPSLLKRSVSEESKGSVSEDRVLEG